MEWCNQSNSIKYLFKYINKGYDRVTVHTSYQRPNEQNPGVVDEIQQYMDCRYVSACESVWRLYGFEIHLRTSPVQRLTFHLPGEQPVVFNDDDPIDDVINRLKVQKSQFLEWMKCNDKFKEAKDLLYIEFPTKFVWNKNTKKWTQRERGFCIGRIHHISPSCRELYYMRILLNYVKGPKTYEDIQTFNDFVHPTFKEACYAQRLLGDDKEYVKAIKEASYWDSGFYLRKLFVILLTSNSLSKPETVWAQTWDLLSDDILHRLENMPFPDYEMAALQGNKFIIDELSYDREAMREDHMRLTASMTEEQRSVYEEIMDSILNCRGGIFFVYGYGGTSKTFIWKTLCAALRSQGEIVLPVASSGIAAILLPGGTTAHSRFGIPINITEN
ncbi:uncharacterized protein LOC141601231 [Silene latifolia]|uniref:uncharacterized protein LOC141601231 n=1 Tax=Silene latifolia TaxID=37657 RepID=UPI003D77D041